MGTPDDTQLFISMDTVDLELLTISALSLVPVERPVTQSRQVRDRAR